jgi:hypothetical protein
MGNASLAVSPSEAIMILASRFGTCFILVDDREEPMELMNR